MRQATYLSAWLAAWSSAVLSNKATMGQVAITFVQVGSYADDSTDLNPPEDMTQARPVFLVNSTAPGSDIAGSSAAALAAAYMVFQSTESSYAATLLTNAKSLYT